MDLSAVFKLVLLLSSVVKPRFLLRLSTRRAHSLRKKLVFLAGKAKLPNLKTAPRLGFILKFLAFEDFFVDGSGFWPLLLS